MRHGVLSAALMWLASCALHAQTPASWLAASVGQNLPADWSWSAAGQLRTAPGAVQWREGIVDLRVGQGLDALPGWSVDGTWRTGWDWPVEGGWTTSWRWATSVKWKKDLGDHSMRLRMRHQFGGPWMRSWDRARWRLQAKWTHDLPDGLEGHPLGGDVLGCRPELVRQPLGPCGRARPLGGRQKSRQAPPPHRGLSVPARRACPPRSARTQRTFGLGRGPEKGQKAQEGRRRPVRKTPYP